MQTRDFETGEMVELTESMFVYGSDIVRCCVPSVIVLRDRERAETLATQHGGTCLTYGGMRATLALESGDGCGMCSKPLDYEAAWPCVLLLEDGTDRAACCPHCAFMLRTMLEDKDGKQVAEIWATAEDGGLLLVGDDTRFVAKSDVPLCCRPTLVPCRSAERATAFIGVHGGEALDPQAAVAFLLEHDHRRQSK
jgi:hypothetical protein